MKISVIVPTCGRDSLKRTLLSLSHQVIEDDDVLLVGDGAQPMAEAMGAIKWPFELRTMSHGPTRNFGNAQRTFAQRVAHGDYIWYLDDDDIAAQDAFIKIRKALKYHPDAAHVFRVVAPWREVVWAEKGVIEQGNVCTIQMVVPNKRSDLPEWPLRQGGNIPWTRAVQQNLGLIWRPEIIAICRPYDEDLWWDKKT